MMAGFVVALVVFIAAVAPAASTDESQKKMCLERKAHLRALTEQTQREIFEQQHPKDCSSVQFLWCDSRGGNINGMGSRTYWLARCIAQAVDMRRTAVLDFEQSGTREMYSPFEPWSNCTMHDVKAAMKNKKGQVVRWDSQGNEGKVVDGIKGAIVPRRYQQYGYAWWKAQELYYVLRPTKATKEAMAKKKRELGWKGLVHAMQVRRTDKVFGCDKKAPVKCKAEAPLRPLSQFGTVLHKAAEDSARPDKGDKKRVFLASDDPGIRKEAKALAGFEFLPYEPPPKRIINKNIGGRALKDAMDMLLLSEAEVLVFTYSSGYGALAFNLKLIREDYCSNFVSVDRGKREYPKIITFGNGGDSGVPRGSRWASNLCYVPPKSRANAPPPDTMSCQIITHPRRGTLEGMCRC